ncbi:hypothetical protein DXG03_006861 [Asterophora parasitica]|uniref:Beta-glucuronidase C-terminal domain-containing protein n=1 Tax=Asterophora parasitica TaxID=117018 RepID=A0A9P7G785_9AGAR|nr:hypothetical protein DXG03_006861 [Asterophora parasitica]
MHLGSVSHKLGVGFSIFSLLVQVNAAVTVYHQTPTVPTPTSAAADAEYTGAAAYNPTTLIPPPVPSPLNTQFTLQLQSGGDVQGLSIPQEGSFLGFSIEMSVANQVLGKNSTFIQVPFLNLMSNLAKRAGRVTVRVGGNTQETAELVDSTPDGRMLEKNISGASNPTQTPPLVFTNDLLHLMRKISSFVDVRWFLGIPFLLDTPNRLDIAEQGQAILGDYLIGLQAGNEPDLYARHGHRDQSYGPFDYFGEFANLVDALTNSSSKNQQTNKNLLIGPNIAYADWTPEQVWDTGFIDSFDANLKYLAVENYPSDNCAAQFNTGGTVRNPQDVFPSYLDHNAGKSIIDKFRNSTALAAQKGKRFLMFETNTASCGGFPGVSDVFGAALWGIDYSLQMATAGFGGALMHVGGQNVFYNPFTPPPTNQSTFHQWTVGPIYYSALAVAETLAPASSSFPASAQTPTTQIMDLNANDGDIHTPAYAVYENGVPVRVGIVNFVTDPSGASDLSVSIAVGGDGQGPKEVKVKYVFTVFVDCWLWGSCIGMRRYLLASSVSQKGNYTWAGQTFGGHFDSDGRPIGTENITTVSCSPACIITVPAPSYVLVFLTPNSDAEAGGVVAATFSTTAQTRVRNTATIDPAVLATSNGGFQKGKLGSTSPGSNSAASVGPSVVLATLLAMALGVGLVGAMRS